MKMKHLTQISYLCSYKLHANANNDFSCIGKGTCLDNGAECMVIEINWEKAYCQFMGPPFEPHKCRKKFRLVIGSITNWIPILKRKVSIHDVYSVSLNIPSLIVLDTLKNTKCMLTLLKINYFLNTAHIQLEWKNEHANLFTGPNSSNCIEEFQTHQMTNF